MTDFARANPPSPFIARWVSRLAAQFPPRPLALDLAMGYGRHAVLMATHGFHVIGLDIQFDAVASAMRDARSRGLVIAGACVDLTRAVLPPDRFHLLVVTRYLDRAALPTLPASLRPGGVLLYETFTARQLEHGRRPRSRAHLLEPGELRASVRGMDVMYDEECTEPDGMARIAARRR